MQHVVLCRTCGTVSVPYPCRSVVPSNCYPFNAPIHSGVALGYACIQPVYLGKDTVLWTCD